MNRKIKEVYDYMVKNIKYGWKDINGEDHINNMKNFRKLYNTMGVEDTIKNKFGTCIEQVALMKYLCDSKNLKSKIFCTRIYERDDFNNLEEEEHMHCFILVYDNDKVYHIEHPNFEKKGIYEYKTEDEAINKINQYYINLSNGVARPVTEIYEITVGKTFKEFNSYVNSLDKIKI